MGKYSSCAKLNEVLLDIEDSLLSFCDTKEQCLSEIRRYIKEFPREPDYNLAAYGNLRIYYYELDYLYKSYKTMKSWSDERKWNLYRNQVGYVARHLVAKKPWCNGANT